MRASTSVAFSSFGSRSSSIAGVAEEGVVVEAHLAVDRQPLASAGQDQRIDLGQCGVFGDVGVVELAGDAGKAVHLVGRQPQPERQLARLEWMKAKDGICVHAHEFLRPLARDLLDVHAALGAGHDEDRALRAIEHDPKIELLGDVYPGHHQDLVDGVSANIHAEDRARGRMRVFRRAGQLDSAGLAASAGVHLCLDRDQSTERRRGGGGFFRSCRHGPGVYRDPVASQNLGRLIFVDIHLRDVLLVSGARPVCVIRRRRGLTVRRTGWGYR